MRPALLFAAAPEHGRALARRWAGQRPAFCCVLGYTDTCMRPGLSAAGISDDARVLTPAADAEVVNLGAARCLAQLPTSPTGIPGPSGITRAALGLAGLQAQFVGAGLRVWPATDCRRLSSQPGADIASGRAVPEARRLFEIGRTLGRELAAQTDWLVLGESVPGGTTTALALLLALGYDARGRVSGSVPDNAHPLKQQVATAALAAAGLGCGDGRRDPLAAVARLGDPMQPVACGVACAAIDAGCAVLLAGGSQMIAVAALMAALGGPATLDSVAIGTTRWLATDPSADIPGLAAEVSDRLPILAVNLDFSGSRHPGLRAYEGFVVKEGVGAGGACIAALLATGLPIGVLERAIDRVYDDLLGRLSVTSA